MDFSSKRINDVSTEYFEADRDSDIQIIVVPGVLNPEVWKHQLRYFSKNYTTFSFGNKVKGYQTELDVVKGILEQEKVNNAVLISSNLGNSVVREFEGHESTIATVYSGLNSNYGFKFPKNIYRLSTAIMKKPKLAKKLFFGEKTDYRVVRQFIRDLNLPEHTEFNSFMRHYRFEKPVKNAFSIHGDRDRFDSIEFAREMKPNMNIGTIKHSGTFSFYEKPEEYNKALRDFITSLEEFVKSREVGKTRSKNRSLKDFEKSEEEKENIEQESDKLLWDRKSKKEKEKAVAKSK